MNGKQISILDRIKHLEEAVVKGREYLESDAHAHWHGFRAFFYVKMRDGKAVPPHKDWIRNVYLPWKERELKRSLSILMRVTDENA